MSTVTLTDEGGCIESSSMKDCSVYGKRSRLGIASNDLEALCLIYVSNRLGIVVAKSEDT